MWLPLRLKQYVSVKPNRLAISLWLITSPVLASTLDSRSEQVLRNGAKLLDVWPWLLMAMLLALVCLVLLGVFYWRSRQYIAKIKQQRQALNHILWGTAAGTWEWNVQTGETRLNQRWAEMVGYRLDELQPTTTQTWTDFCHPDDLEDANKALQDHFNGDAESYSQELRLRHRDGHWIWIHDRGRVVARDEAGNPLWMAGTHIDITQRKEAEEKARATTEQLSKLTALLPGAIYQYWQGVDGSAHFPYASASIQNIYGVTPEQARQDVSRVFDVIHRDDLERVANSINESSTSLSEWNITFRVNHPNGRLLWIEGNSTPERLKDGSTMWHGYLRDITPAYLLQKERDDYRKSLEKSNLELEHFAYAASHDLRQPLRMVTSYAQLLKRHLGDRLDEDGSTMLHYMSDGAKRMDAMLLSLLEYSRIGRQGQPFSTFSLREPLDEALHFLAPAIMDADATIRVTGECPDVVASRDEVTRLFQNIISNALKYQPSDASVDVHIAIQYRYAEDDCYVMISDNGIGIDAEQIPRLFQVFQRLHTREQFEGTGVGLAICRKIIERHEGKIWVTSAGKGQGTCFHLTLPCRLQVAT